MRPPGGVALGVDRLLMLLHEMPPHSRWSVHSPPVNSRPPPSAGCGIIRPLSTPTPCRLGSVYAPRPLLPRLQPCVAPRRTARLRPLLHPHRRSGDVLTRSCGRADCWPVADRAAGSSPAPSRPQTAAAKPSRLVLTPSAGSCDRAAPPADGLVVDMKRMRALGRRGASTHHLREPRAPEAHLLEKQLNPVGSGHFPPSIMCSDGRRLAGDPQQDQIFDKYGKIEDLVEHRACHRHRWKSTSGQ